MPVFANSNVFVLGQWGRLQWESREPLCWFWEHCDTWKKRGRLHQQCHVFYLLGRSRCFQLLSLCVLFFSPFVCLFFRVGAVLQLELASLRPSPKTMWVFERRSRWCFYSWSRTRDSSFNHNWVVLHECAVVHHQPVRVFTRARPDDTQAEFPIDVCKTNTLPRS